MSGPLELLRQAAKARAQGYTKPVYHGTRTAGDIDQFRLDHGLNRGDFGVHVAERPDTAMGALWAFASRKNNQQKAANLYGSSLYREAMRENDFMMRDAAIMPLRMRLGHVVPTVPDLGRWDDPGRWLDKATLLQDGRSIRNLWRSPTREELRPRLGSELPHDERMLLPPRMWNDLTDAAFDIEFSDRALGSGARGNQWKQALQEAANRHGATGYRYLNVVEARPRPSLPPWSLEGSRLLNTPDWSYIVTDPDALRLPWAGYEPQFQGTGRLLRRAGGSV